MEDAALNEYLDQSRWLLNSGLITDNVKNELFKFVAVIYPQDDYAICTAEVDIIPDNKMVNYRIYVNKFIMDLITRHAVLSKDFSLLGRWKLKRLLKVDGMLDILRFQSTIDQLVKSFCGPKWSATIKVLDFDEYVEGFEQTDGDASEADGGSQQSYKLPD